MLREVNTWASEHGEQELLARSHRLLSTLFRRIGDPALMLEHAVTAVDLLDADTADTVRADQLLGLADALGASGSYPESLHRYQLAAALAERSDDEHLRLTVLNNLAYTQYQAGLADAAVATAEQLRPALDAPDQPLNTHIRDTIARAYMLVGR